MVIFFICYFTNVDSVIDFADYLYKNKEYEAAITEYKRALFIGVNDSDYVNLKIGKAYYLLEDYDKSNEYLEKVKNDTSNIIIGFIQIDRKNIKEANKYFEKIQEDKLKKEINTAYNKLLNINKKNIFIAGILGVVPGLGKIYAGRWKDGLLSLFFIANYGSISYYCYKKEKYNLAIGFGVFSFLLYIGNIYGGTRAAKIYNEREFYKKLNEVKNNLYNIIY